MWNIRSRPSRRFIAAAAGGTVRDREIEKDRETDETTAHRQRQAARTGSSRVQRADLGRRRGILPDINGGVGRYDDVVAGHGDIKRLDIEVLAVHRRADGVAENDEVSGSREPTNNDKA
jgi:hypothetical protein